MLEGQIGGWAPLGDPPAETLFAARSQLHWAIQFVSAVGHTHIAARDDLSHLNVGWDGGELAGHLVDGDSPVRAALRIAELALVVEDGEGRALSELALAGKTMEEGYQWLADALAAVGREEPLARLQNEHALPPHAVGAGGAFALAPAEAFAELGRWYGNADAVLQRVAAAIPQASAVRAWPEHFDIATLVALDGEKTVGLGMTPGDDSYREPYWYVSPWPYPESPNPPELAGSGHWHREGWFGAVLPASDMAADAEGQARQVADFLRSAAAACYGFHGLPFDH